jgi:hypothetical protein
MGRADYEAELSPIGADHVQNGVDDDAAGMLRDPARRLDQREHRLHDIPLPVGQVRWIPALAPRPAHRANPLGHTGAVLVADDTGFVKKGDKRAGVQRQ